jgi:hypothetical protein
LVADVTRREPINSGALVVPLLRVSRCQIPENLPGLAASMKLNDTERSPEVTLYRPKMGGLDGAVRWGPEVSIMV